MFIFKMRDFFFLENFDSIGSSWETCIGNQGIREGKVHFMVFIQCSWFIQAALKAMPIISFGNRRGNTITGHVLWTTVNTASVC